MIAESKGVKTTKFSYKIMKRIAKGPLKQHTNVFRNTCIFCVEMTLLKIRTFAVHFITQWGKDF
jgi:hypothetical protein